MNNEQKQELLKRVKVRVEFDGDCWIWKQGLTNQGYPQMAFLGKPGLVGRLVYAATKGNLKPKWSIVASCGNRLCVSPSCLIQRDRGAVLRDAWASGARDMIRHKEKSREAVMKRGWAKIGPGDAAEIKVDLFMARESKDPDPVGRVAKDRGLSRRLVKSVDDGQTWGDIGRPVSSVFRIGGIV